jgi:hypothetical protein
VCQEAGAGSDSGPVGSDVMHSRLAVRGAPSAFPSFRFSALLLLLSLLLLPLLFCAVVLPSTTWFYACSCLPCVPSAGPEGA